MIELHPTVIHGVNEDGETIFELKYRYCDNSTAELKVDTGIDNIFMDELFGSIREAALMMGLKCDNVRVKMEDGIMRITTKGVAK